MATRRQAVIPYRVSYDCPREYPVAGLAQPCTGSMEHDGYEQIPRGQTEKQYRHRCTVCGFSMFMPNSYPKMEYEPVPATETVDGH